MELNFINIVDVLGTFSFAVAGGFAAMEKKLDPFGVLIMAFATAIGGGTIRDLMLGRLPVAWLTNSPAIWAIIIGAVATMFFSNSLKKAHRLLFYFDAIGLGLFTMIGIQAAREHDLSMGICIMMGTITGCFGGVLRDVLLNNVPLLFQKEIYALASIFGGLVFFLLSNLDLPLNYSYAIGIIVVVLIRILAVKFSWSLPRFYEER